MAFATLTKYGAGGARPIALIPDSQSQPPMRAARKITVKFPNVASIQPDQK